MALQFKKYWINFFIFLCLMISILFTVLWFYVWPKGLGTEKQGFLFFLVRYGHSFVWFLISIATAIVWVRLVLTGQLVVTRNTKLIYQLAGCTYALFVFFLL
ncbi:hypothetical protein CH372_01720 [Leptospira meyeri]|nr:hypothetical protein CH372_01720 [Leptospira meyeri]